MAAASFALLWIAGGAGATTVFSDGASHIITSDDYDNDGSVDGDEIQVLDGPGATPTSVTFQGSGYEIGGNSASPFSLRVLESSQATIDGDVIFVRKVDVCPALTCNQASVVINEGSLLQDIELYQNARLFINGGTINEVKSFDDASVFFTGGDVIGDIESGDPFAFAFTGSATLELNGGNVGDDLDFFELSKGFISAGTIADSLRVRDESNVEIFGTGFAINGIAVSGQLDPFDGGAGELAADCTLGVDCPQLTGTLQGGQALSVELFFSSDATLTFTEATPIPEPGTAAMILAGLTGLAVMGRRRY